jgi:acetyl-CoA acyltransferase
VRSLRERWTYAAKPDSWQKLLVPFVFGQAMGLGPALAIPKALKKAGVDKDAVDLFEINEAFAAQVIACDRLYGLPKEKLNVNGGGIALGHPIGATGVRLTLTLLYELKRRDARCGVVSLCVGGGMGAALVFERA